MNSHLAEVHPYMVTNSLALDVLDQIDHELKQTIKAIRNSATDEIIYTDKSYGALSVQKVVNIVMIPKLKNALKMNESSDPAV